LAQELYTSWCSLYFAFFSKKRTLFSLRASTFLSRPQTRVHKLRMTNGPEPKKMVEKKEVWTDLEIRRLWETMDRNNSGSIRVVDLVKNSQALQKRCPQIIKRHGEIAKNGGIKFADFRDLLQGKKRTPRPAHGGQVSPKKGKPLTTHQPPEMSKEQLDRIWSTVARGKDKIQLCDICEHKEFLRTEFPDLVTNFEDIDLNEDGTIGYDEIKVYVGGVAVWLEEQLKKIVGLETLKEQIQTFYRSVVLDRKRRQQGAAIQGNAQAIHMIFQGNPGTGKTSVARIMAKLLAKIGVIESPGKLTEVQRSDLVASYVGQTATKTKQIMADSKSGVLFIDEAYRLSQGKSGQDFGREAIEELMSAMNEPPGKAPIMIFAGYSGDMNSFMQTNDGLYRRIAYTFDFQDYDCDSLALILELYTTGRGFTIGVGVEKVAHIIEENTSMQQRSRMNGGLAERIFTGAKQYLDSRTDPQNPEIVLSADDIKRACQDMPPPPERVDEDTPRRPSATIAHQEPTAAITPAMVNFQSQAPRNLVIEIVCCKDVKLPWYYPFKTPYLICRSDKKEVIRVTRNRKKSTPDSLTFHEERIISVPAGSHLFEAVLKVKAPLRSDKFLGNGTLAFSQLPFSGNMTLSRNDYQIGTLQIKARWQGRI